MYIFQIVI